MSFAPKLLNDADLKALGVSAQDVVAAIEATVLDKAAGRLITTPKSVIQPGDGRYMMTTLASGDVTGLTVVKAVTVCPDNPAKGLPSIMGAIMVLDATTGACLAVMDAEWITGVRTAGLSAVAARRLADPQSETIGFVGTGVQARSHLQLFAQLFPLKTVRMTGRGQANLDRLSDVARDLGLVPEICAPDAVLQSEIVVTSIPITFAGAPFLDARQMRDGALAIVTDAAKPWVPEGRAGFGTVVVDDRAQEESMPEPVVPPAQITGDLVDLLDKGITPAPGPRAFMFRGIAAGDYAMAARLWQMAATRSG